MRRFPMALTMAGSRWSKNRIAPVQPDLAAELIAAIDNGDLIFTRPDERPACHSCRDESLVAGNFPACRAPEPA